MTMNNNIDGEFYVLDKYNKTFNVAWKRYFWKHDDS